VEEKEKVKLEISPPLFRALTIVAEGFGRSPEEYASDVLEDWLKTQSEDGFASPMECKGQELAKAVRAALEAPT